MATYDVALYATEELRAYADERYGDPDRPQRRAGVFVRGAFDRTPHRVRLLFTSRGVPTPTDRTREPFRAPCPSNPDMTCSYSSLLWWFVDWTAVADVPTGADDTLLLTNTKRAGGLTAKSHSVAGSGRLVCELPDEYVPYATDARFDGAQTVLHELGHAFMGFAGDADGDGVGHHDVGAVRERPCGRTLTPMGIAGEVNSCGERYDTSDLAGHELCWSSCCLSRWASPKAPVNARPAPRGG